MSKRWTVSEWTSAQRLTTVKNGDICYIFGDIELNPGPSNGNRIGNQGDELLNVIFVTKLYEETLSDLCVNTANS